MASIPRDMLPTLGQSRNIAHGGACRPPMHYLLQNVDLQNVDPQNLNAGLREVGGPEPWNDGSWSAPTAKRECYFVPSATVWAYWAVLIRLSYQLLPFKQHCTL